MNLYHCQNIKTKVMKNTKNQNKIITTKDDIQILLSVVYLIFISFNSLNVP